MEEATAAVTVAAARAAARVAEMAVGAVVATVGGMAAAARAEAVKVVEATEAATAEAMVVVTVAVRAEEVRAEGETAEGIRTGSGLAAGHRTAASDQILHPGNHGNSLKTSVAYTCSRDGRDHPLVPTEGSLFRATGEVAGLVGDVSFLKGEMGRDWRGDSGLERRREDVRYKKKAHLRWDMVEMWLQCVWCVCL